MKAALLHQFLSEHQGRAFSPGEWDCALFAAEWVKASTGQDLAQKFRGKYKTTAAGFKLIAKDGYESHIDIASRVFPEVHPAFAQVGDLAVIEGAMGVVAGEHVFFLRETGFGIVLLEQAERAFEVR